MEKGLLAKEHSRTPEKAQETKYDFLLSDCDCLKTKLFYVHILVCHVSGVMKTSYIQKSLRHPSLQDIQEPVFSYLAIFHEIIWLVEKGLAKEHSRTPEEASETKYDILLMPSC